MEKDAFVLNIKFPHALVQKLLLLYISVTLLAVLILIVKSLLFEKERNIVNAKEDVI